MRERSSVRSAISIRLATIGLALISLALGLPFPCAVAAQGQVTMHVRAGYDGYYKPESWIPVQVIVENGGPDIAGRIRVESSDQWHNEVYTQPATLPSQSRKQFTFYVFVRYTSQDLSVRLREGSQTLAQQMVRVQPIGDRDYLYGVVSDDPSALSYLAGLPARGSRRTHVAHLDLSDLSTQGRSLTGLDMLVLDGVDSSSLSAAQRDALRGWVALGGHLVICGGPYALPTAAGLGDLLPVAIHGSETTTDVSELGEYAGAPFIAQMPAVVSLVTPTAPGAQVLAGAPGRPFLIRQPLDAGYIDYLALDPDLEPLRTWLGNDNLWTKLTFGAPLAERLAPDAEWSNISSALSNLSGIAIPSLLLVLGFLFAYVVTVGPLNFLVLRWADRRMLAWITVPLLILLFSCVAYVIGFASRGRKVVVSEVSIVRPRSASRTAVVDSYVGLYSPARNTYDVRLPDGVLVRDANPYYATVGISTEELVVEQGPPTWLRELEIDVGGMRAFMMQATQPWAGIEADLTLTADGTSYHVRGTIANRSDTDIENCALLFQSQPVPIPDLPAGETRTIAVDFPSQSAVPSYTLVEELIDKTSAGAERREKERRRAVLHGIYQRGPLPPTGSGSAPAGLVMLGWTDRSLLPVEVVEAPTAGHATVLVLAPLPFSSGDQGTTVVPMRSMSWQYTGSGTGVSPYELYRDTADETFAFMLPLDPDGQVVDHLTLHVDAVDDYGYYGQVPTIWVRDVASQDWIVVDPLSWGTNALAPPQRFVDAEGRIEVKIATSTIEQTVSVDLSAILREQD